MLPYFFALGHRDDSYLAAEPSNAIRLIRNGNSLRALREPSEQYGEKEEPKGNAHKGDKPAHFPQGPYLTRKGLISDEDGKILISKVARMRDMPVRGTPWTFCPCWMSPLPPFCLLSCLAQPAVIPLSSWESSFCVPLELLVLQAFSPRARQW